MVTITDNNRNLGNVARDEPYTEEREKRKRERSQKKYDCTQFRIHERSLVERKIRGDRYIAQCSVTN